MKEKEIKEKLGKLQSLPPKHTLRREDIKIMCDKLKYELEGDPPYPYEFTDAIFLYDSIEGRLLKIEVNLVPVEQP